MSSKKIMKNLPKILRWLRIVYPWVLGALILASGVGLAVSCLAIYQDGGSPFTRESISLHFRRVAPLVYAVLIGVAGGGVLSLFLPCEERGDMGRGRSARGMVNHRKSFYDNIYFVWVVRCAVAVIGVAFVVLGVLNGGMEDVLGKAIRICTECIGLG